jgi:hypothetical protein
VLCDELVPCVGVGELHNGRIDLFELLLHVDEMRNGVSENGEGMLPRWHNLLR